MKPKFHVPFMSHCLFHATHLFKICRHMIKATSLSEIPGKWPCGLWDSTADFYSHAEHLLNEIQTLLHLHCRTCMVTGQRDSSSPSHFMWLSHWPGAWKILLKTILLICSCHFRGLFAVTGYYILRGKQKNCPVVVVYLQFCVARTKTL